MMAGSMAQRLSSIPVGALSTAGWECPWFKKPNAGTEQWRTAHYPLQVPHTRTQTLPANVDVPPLFSFCDFQTKTLRKDGSLAFMGGLGAMMYPPGVCQSSCQSRPDLQANTACGTKRRSLRGMLRKVNCKSANCQARRSDLPAQVWPRLPCQPVSFLGRGQVAVCPERSAAVGPNVSSCMGRLGVFGVLGLRLKRKELTSLFEHGTGTSSTNDVPLSQRKPRAESPCLVLPNGATSTVDLVVHVYTKNTTQALRRTSHN